MELNLKIPQIISETLFNDKYYRYICLYGGRGSGKSWGVADFLIVKSLMNKERILCTREYQTNIKDSVYKLLVDRIEEHHLDYYFNITRESIKSKNGSEFIFKGLAMNIQEIKSTEGVSLCWIEEAEKVGEEHWDILCPTIRKENSKILITFNPEDEENATYKRFVANPSNDTLAVKVNYWHNPFFTDVLKKEMEYDKQNDFEKYLWKWEGEPRKVNEAIVFKGRWEEKEFITDEDENRFFWGCDWGFANDPTVLLRCYIRNGNLYVDREAYGVGIDLDELPALFDSIDVGRRNKIEADCARPETISYMAKQGYNIEGASKWKGSVEDGVEYLKSFAKIIIHPRCKHTIEEMKTYSYKRDKNSMEVLPILLDKNNHCIDALRYALNSYILLKGTIAEIL